MNVELDSLMPLMDMADLLTDSQMQLLNEEANGFEKLFCDNDEEIKEILNEVYNMTILKEALRVGSLNKLEKNVYIVLNELDILKNRELTDKQQQLLDILIKFKPFYEEMTKKIQNAINNKIQ